MEQQQQAIARLRKDAKAEGFPQSGMDATDITDVGLSASSQADAMRVVSLHLTIVCVASPLLAIVGSLLLIESSVAAGCMLAPQGDGRVAEVIDVRTVRLQDGAEVRLAGIEPIAQASNSTSTTSDLIAGRDVTLHGDNDVPDRYGRQPAFVYLDPAGPSAQAQLLARGAALYSGAITDKACAAELTAAESTARLAKHGIWAQSNVIKNAESTGDILADVGRFAVIEGRVASVRQAGTTTYLNFGRRWTQDFAVTISRRMMAALENAGIAPKSLERRRIRIRGWVERRGGPRIEVLRMGQIEVVGDP